MATVVQTPDGGRWRVGRRWVPWRFRLRKTKDAIDNLDLPLDGCLPLDDIFIGIGIVIAVVVFVVFLLPIVIALIELTLLLLLVAAGVLVRVLLRRPWIVDVQRLDAHGGSSWKVVGWRRSGELVTALATQLQSGQPMTGLPDATPC